MTEARQIFGIEEIKQLVRAYEAYCDELGQTYYNQDEDAIRTTYAVVDSLLMGWGLWDDDCGWRV